MITPKKKNNFTSLLCELYSSFPHLDSPSIFFLAPSSLALVSFHLFLLDQAEKRFSSGARCGISSILQSKERCSASSTAVSSRRRASSASRPSSVSDLVHILPSLSASSPSFSSARALIIQFAFSLVLQSFLLDLSWEDVVLEFSHPNPSSE